MKRLAFIAFGLILFAVQEQLIAQQIPAVYSNVFNTDSGLVFIDNDNVYKSVERQQGYSLSQFVNAPMGSSKGIAFNFNDTSLQGGIYYGFINVNHETYPLPVYFKKIAPINNGQAEINLRKMTGKYDMVNWQNSKQGLLAYRVVNATGEILYDGRVRFSYNGSFAVEPTIIEGPTLHQVTDSSAIVRVVLNKAAAVELWINKKIVKSKESKVHEIKVSGLAANTAYRYEIEGLGSRTYQLKTAITKGARTPFVFSYASDSRNGNGGGERNIYGANAYIMNRIMALNKLKQVSFMQFSGDLIDGYLSSKPEMSLQYANWKRSLEPFSHYLPVYVAMGNHEALGFVFKNQKQWVMVDKFPFDTQSAEKEFQDNFCNPVSDLVSEDGCKYDPNENTMDFPSYAETVYSYTYGNVAMVVLNSNYWYAPMAHVNSTSGGNIHAYIMDNQLNWLKTELAKYENDKGIDHVFITQHTPFFPNGGHVEDDMWYNGSNQPRPEIAGKPVDKGIIERRDELLDIIVNKSPKVKAILTGDEHNYAKTQIGPATAKYPMNWSLPKLELKRSIYQINNGSAGAPYYAQEKTPWTNMVTGFSTQNVNVLFYVEGKKVRMEVINPLTFELVDSMTF